MSKVIYEPHPVHPARKAKLQAEGYKILDAIFAPAGTPLHQSIDEATTEVVVEVEQEEVIEEVIVDAPAKPARSKKG
jgi:hypothetical protein